MSDTPPSIPPAGKRQRPSSPAAPASAAPPVIPAPQRRSVRPSATPPPQVPGPQPTVVQPASAPQAAPAAQPPAYAPRRNVNRPAPRTQAPITPATPVAGSPSARPNQKPRIRRKRRWGIIIPVTILVLLLAWPAWLLYDTNANLNRIDALVPGPDSPGTTYLLAGSDTREDGTVDDGTEGSRSDSIMMIHVAPNGQTTMLSLPRDTYVEIPEYGYNKINAAFSFGGAQLLVETVQNLTGIAIDHYVEINMSGVGKLVDAVGGVNLCMDFDASDGYSGLEWTAGCHDVDGTVALAFARMRYEDVRGDLGRAQRQREVISAVTQKAVSPATFINPFAQMSLARAGTSAITVDQSASVFDIAKLLFAFRDASGSGMTGTPPLSSVAEETDAGLAVMLNDELAPDFFARLAKGTLTKADFDSDF